MPSFHFVKLSKRYPHPLWDLIPSIHVFDHIKIIVRIFSKSNSNVLRHRIRKKLKKVKQDLDLLMKNCGDVGISQQEMLAVASFSNGVAVQDKISQLQKNETKRFKSLSKFENW